jgi:hypothetical protein
MYHQVLVKFFNVKFHGNRLAFHELFHTDGQTDATILAGSPHGGERT